MNYEFYNTVDGMKYNSAKDAFVGPVDGRQIGVLPELFITEVRELHKDVDVTLPGFWEKFVGEMEGVFWVAE